MFRSGLKTYYFKRTFIHRDFIYNQNFVNLKEFFFNCKVHLIRKLIQLIRIIYFTNLKDVAPVLPWNHRFWIDHSPTELVLVFAWSARLEVGSRRSRFGSTLGPVFSWWFWFLVDLLCSYNHDERKD